MVALEPFSDGSASEKQQLSRYYDQLRQSILENGGGYVDALLDSAQAAYSVDLTNDRLEPGVLRGRRGFADPDMQLPCSYTAFCREHVGSVTESTLESYRLADSSEKLLARFKGGANEVTIESAKQDRTASRNGRKRSCSCRKIRNTAVTSKMSFPSCAASC